LTIARFRGLLKLSWERARALATTDLKERQTVTASCAFSTAGQQRIDWRSSKHMAFASAPRLAARLQIDSPR
jgi:hypothetical protein